MNLRELEEHLEQIKLSLDGREPDVQDLDDNGWKAVSKAGKIVELGSLGEGAGGAVTRCVLKGGRTVFALKVGLLPLHFYCRRRNYGADST
jgi:mitogen-activated protein kinase kinase